MPLTIYPPSLGLYIYIYIYIHIFYTSDILFLYLLNMIWVGPFEFLKPRKGGEEPPTQSFSFALLHFHCTELLAY